MSRALDELEITTLVLKNFPLLGHRCRPSSSATGRFCTGVSHCKPHNLYSFCHGVFMYPFCFAFLLLNFIPRAIRKTLRQSPSSFNRTLHFTHSRTSHFPPNASLRIWSSLNPPSRDFCHSVQYTVERSFLPCDRCEHRGKCVAMSVWDRCCDERPPVVYCNVFPHCAS